MLTWAGMEWRTPEKFSFRLQIQPRTSPWDAGSAEMNRTDFKPSLYRSQLGGLAPHFTVWGNLRPISDTSLFIHGKDSTRQYSLTHTALCSGWMRKWGLNLISVFFPKSDQPVDHFRILTLGTAHSHSDILAIVFSGELTLIKHLYVMEPCSTFYMMHHLP